MNTSKQQIGNLTCHVVDRLARENKPELIVVLCHGYGAPGTDLVPLAGEVLGSWPRLADRVRFVFPQAPHSLDEIGVYDGRAWWHVDVAELSAKIMKGELRDIAEDVPPELPGSRDLLMGTITSLSRESGLPLSQFVLGGFSQGSILALDVALRLEQTVASSFVWSGTLVAEKEWVELAKRHPKLRIQQSHGEMDLVLPYVAAEWLRDAMIDAGLEVQFLRFDGGHTIPMEALQRFGTRLVELTSE